MAWTRRNRLWLVLGAALLLTALLVWYSGRQPLTKVTVVKVVRDNLSASISSNGKVEPITPYSMRAKLATFVDRVLAVEGQQVRRGQLLLTLDVEQARADLARAREQLLSAEDDLRAARAGGPADEMARLQSDLAKTEIERARLQREHEALQRLVAQKAATKEELAQNQVALAKADADWQRLQKTQAEMKRKAALDVERASLRAAESRDAVAALQERVSSARVTASVDGTLYSLPVHPRDFVHVGDLLAEMADLRRVRVRAFIDEPELGGLEPNQNVEITWDGLPSRRWFGRTEIIPKQVVAHGTRSVGEVLCSVDNSKLELLPNINVNVSIHLRERAGVLVVPRGAVYIEGTRRYVYVVEEGRLGVERSRLIKREIAVGIASATSFEVVGGLHEGDTVALPADVPLSDRMSVKVLNPQ